MKSGEKRMNKAHPSAARLYIGTGFAHMHSQEKCIWVNMNLSLELNLGRRANGPLNNAAGTRVELQASGIASLSSAGGGFGLSYKHQALTRRILYDSI